MRRTIALLMLALGVPMAAAQVYPPAPQGPQATDGVDTGTGVHAGFVRVPAGGNGPVDAWGKCRWVSNGNGRELVVPVADPSEWQSVRAGESTGLPPPGLGEVVCCRPASVTLCAGAAGGTVSETLPYTPFGQTAQPVGTCTDAWGKSYTDSQIWSCGMSGSGAAADGVWTQTGGDTLGCTANAFSAACSAACTQATYDSCGNLTATTSCSGGACVPACTQTYIYEYPFACVYSESVVGQWGTVGVALDVGTCNDSYTFYAPCSPGCSPNATFGACSKTCGGGSQTVYDSCGNAAGTQSCNTQACATCTPQYAKSCSQSTAVYTDTACGTGSYTVANGCTFGEIGQGYCPYETLYSSTQSNPPSCSRYCGCGDAVCQPLTWVVTGDAYASPVPYSVNLGCATGVYTQTGTTPPNHGCNISSITFVCMGWQ